MNARSSLLQQCFEDVLAQAPRLVGRCLESMIQGLLGAGGSAGDVMVADGKSVAWAGLMRHRAAWTRAYPEQLRAALERADDDMDTGSLPLASDSALLSLVDEAEYAEQIEFKRMLQQLQPLVEHELAALDARMSSLVGLGSIRADRNPLRPSVMARSLYRVMQESEPDREVRSVWLRHLAEPLGVELRQLYGAVALKLQRANVEEASYRVRLVSDPTGPRVPDQPDDSRYGLTTEWFDLPGAEPAPPTEDLGSWRHADLACLRSQVDPEVYQQFLSETGPGTDEPLEADYHLALAREAQRLASDAAGYVHDDAQVQARRSAHAATAAVDRPWRGVDTDSALLQSTWGELANPHARASVLLGLKQEARRVDQAMGLDVVRMLVNQVARDPLLLAPVREAVVALEPALLRLVPADPRYFAQPEHPARRLVEGVAQRSFRYNDEFAPDFLAFMRPVEQGFAALLAHGGQQAHPFAKVLAALQASWALVDAREHERRENSLQAVRHADERQDRADDVVRELSQRPDIDFAPAFLVDFLYGPWALVIASAALDQPGAIDPGGYRKVVSDLIWSVRRDITLRMPGRLFELLPGMLHTLRDGLRTLGTGDAVHQPFFDTLMELHEPVLKLRRAQARRSLGENSMPAELPVLTDILPPATPEQRLPRAAEEPWLAPLEQEATGFVDGSPWMDTEQEAWAEPDTTVSVASVASLSVGDWFDLRVGEEWLRAQLVWSNARGTLFMFISQGGRSHSMTRRSCERLLGDRSLRPVGSRDVVQQALQAVTRDTPQALAPL